jgi:preprotein translocase subunit SecD
MKMPPRPAASLAIASLLALTPHCIGADREGAGDAQAASSAKYSLKLSLSYRLCLSPSKDPQTGEKHPVDAAALARLKEVLGRYLSSAGVNNVELTPQPPDHLLIRGEGLTPEQVSNVDKSIDQTGEQLSAINKDAARTPALDFRLVHGDSDALLPKIESEKMKLDPDWVILPMKEIRTGEDKPRKLIVKRIPEITGNEITEANVVFDLQGWVIKVHFNKRAGRKFFDITRKMRVAVDRFAIVLDGKILSAPTTSVQGGIFGGSCEITGKFTEQEAKELATALTNQIRNPIVIEDESVK